MAQNYWNMQARMGYVCAMLFDKRQSVCLSLQIYHTSDYLGTSMVVFKYYHACY